MARSILLVFFIAMSLMSVASEQGDEPYFVKAWLEPTKAAPGQHMVLNILLGVDSYFAKAAELSLPEIDHALVLLNDRAINSSENSNSKRFATQLWEVNVYPNREGILVVPSFTVRFTRAVHRNNEISQQGIEVDIEQLLGLVSMPAAMKGLSGFMVSTDVEINDEWILPEGKETFTRGDIFQREISISAKDMTAMNMPQFNPRVARGMSITLAEPSLASSNGRDGARARMVQQITYVIEKPGQFSLGGESISWWNPEEATREDYRFESKAINAGGIPWHWVLTVAAMLLLIVGAGLGFRRYLLARDPRDVAIKKGLHHSDASRRMAALYAYVDYHSPRGSEPLRLRALCISTGSPIEKMLSSRFSASMEDGEPSTKECIKIYKQLKKLLC